MAFFIDSVIWVSLYALTQIFFRIFTITYDSMLAIAVNISYWIALFMHLKRENLLSKCGICIPLHPWHQSAVILLLIPAFQCFLYGFPRVSPRELLVLLLAVLAEEIAFRMLLPKILLERIQISVINATFFSSIIFALFHGVSSFKAESLTIVLLQVLYAFCAGWAFCALTQRTSSVLPSIALHTLINWTAGGQTTRMTLLISTLAFSIFFVSYVIISFYKTERGTTYL